MCKQQVPCGHSPVHRGILAMVTGAPPQRLVAVVAVTSRVPSSLDRDGFS